MSLGVNLLPVDNKICSFNCIYCECGWGIKGLKPRFNSRSDVYEGLKAKLTEMSAAGELPDVITFAGNGEPTMHPEFREIIDDTIKLRDSLAPSAKIAVLSNATMIARPGVKEALLKVDRNILKLDSAFDDTVRLIDNPNGTYSVAETVERMKSFNGRLIIQTMFLKGEYNGKQVDNTTEKEVSAWLKLVEKVKPQQVMIYTIDRDTPAQNLQKIPLEKLNAIAERVKALGIDCSVSG